MNDKFNICLMCENKKPYNCYSFINCVELLENDRTCITCKCSDCIRNIHNSECLLAEPNDNFIPIKKVK